MQQYFIEGLFANKQGVKKARKTGVFPPTSIEPYARTIWANSPDEAIRLATAEIDGGVWTEGPHVSKITEEQRMRSMGAPEFPGLTPRVTPKRKR